MAHYLSGMISPASLRGLGAFDPFAPQNAEALRQKNILFSRIPYSLWITNPFVYSRGSGKFISGPDDSDSWATLDELKARFESNWNYWRTFVQNPQGYGAIPKFSNIPTFAQWVATDPVIVGDNPPEYQYLFTYYTLPANEGDWWEKFGAPVLISAFGAGMASGFFPTSGFEGMGTFGGSVAAHGGGLQDIFTAFDGAAGGAPVDASAGLDMESIDGSMQSIYDANAAAGVPGYDPSLVSGAGSGSSTLENLWEAAKQIPKSLPGGSVTIPGTSVALPGALVTSAIRSVTGGGGGSQPPRGTGPQFLFPNDTRYPVATGPNSGSLTQNINESSLLALLAAGVALVVALRKR